MNKITELRQETSELKDDLARLMKEMESNLVMTETVTLPSQVKLKRVGRCHKWRICTCYQQRMALILIS
jgi:hypothetical protein